MTLEQAIDRYSNNAEYERRNGSLHGCMEFRQQCGAKMVEPQESEDKE